jgi:long-chain acyl-CoA synthetase
VGRARLLISVTGAPVRSVLNRPSLPRDRGRNRTLTNAELLSRIRAAAAHQLDLGIGPGEGIALKLTNRIEFVLLLFASWRLGATVTPVNPTMIDIEVARQLNDSAARLLKVEDSATSIDDVTTLTIGDLAAETTLPDQTPPPRAVGAGPAHLHQRHDPASQRA